MLIRLKDSQNIFWQYFLRILIFTSFGISPSLLSIEPQIVIHWSSITTPGHNDLLKDRNQQLLDSGATSNGDGNLVSLGYFSDANSTHPFNGTWVPLTYGTRIGDSSSGYGYDDGMFSFTTVFTNNSDEVIVYPNKPASYTVQSPFTIQSNAPPPGKIICIRFYDRSFTGPSARYNTVTGTDWVWPSYSSGIPTNLYLKIASSSNSGWKTGNIFEDPSNPFKCTLREPANLSITHSNGGSVIDVSGQHPYDSWVDLNATPAPHFDFVRWDGGVEFPNSASTRVQMTSDKNVTAIFTDHFYNLSISKSGKGTISGEGNYTYGTNVSIQANPSAGYFFSHWNGYGPDNNNSSTNLTIQQDHIITAVFNPNPHTLNVTASSGGSASILESSPYHYDGNYTLTATPSAGYEFSSWTSSTNSLNILSSNSTSVSTLILDGNAAFHATFFEKNYNLTLTLGDGGESISPSSSSFSHFDNVPVEANASVGYEFTRWDDPSGIIISPLSQSTVASMSVANGDANITALFQKKTYNIVISEDGGGNVILENGPHEHFGVYDLTAIPHTNYLFSHWSGDTNSTSALILENNVSINKIGVTGPISLTAHFVIDPTTLSYYLDLNSSNGGTVQIAAGSNPFQYETNATIQATPSTGYNFTGWSSFTNSLDLLSSSTSSTPYLIVDQNASFTAHFHEKQYLLGVNFSVGGHSVSPSGTTLHSHFSSSPVSANSLYGYKFKNWEDLNGLLVNPLDANTTAIFANASMDSNITAVFEPKDYNISIVQPVGGTISLDSPSGPWLHFQTYNIVATPQTGYRFLNWSGNQAGLNALVDNPQEANNSLNLIESISLSANFDPIDYEILIDSTFGGSVSGEGNYTILNSPSISATPITGWEFSGWTGDVQALQTSSAPSSTVNLSAFPQNLNFHASFKRKSYTINFELIGSGFINDSNTSFTETHSFEDNVTFNATPKDGWQFNNWIGVEENLKLTNPLELTIENNLDLKATFSKKSFTLTLGTSAWGQVTGNGSYLFEDNVTISATPNAGYTFSHWEGNTTILADALSSSNSFQIPNGNLAFTPVFSPIEHTLNVQANGGGVASGGGKYFTDENATLSASANPPDANSLNGYHLSYWEWTTPGGVITTSSENPVNLTVDSNLSIVAYFIPTPYTMHTLNVVKSNATAGNIFDNPGMQTWDASTQSTKRTVLTRPSTGWKFSHWASNSGNLTIQNPLELSSQFILQSDSSVNANFLNSNVELELSTDGGGQTSFNTKSVPFGDSVTISASANNHKVFKEWEILKEFTYEVKNSNSSVSPARTVYFLNERERPSLTFYKDFTYTFTFDQNQGEDFYISTSPNSTSDASAEVISSTTRSAISGKSLTFYVNQNSPNLLYYHSKANPGMGSSINVVDAVPTNLIPNYNSVENIITPQSDLLIKANFQNVYTLTLGTSAWGQVTGDGNYLFEDNVTISATPNAGYTFSHWEGNTTILADALSSSNSFQIPNGNLAFTPVFSPIEHTLNVQANGGGVASGGGKYFTDENATLSASANPPDANSLNGYHLSYWEWTTPGGTVTTSSENPVSITVDSNLSIIAYFIPTPYSMHILDVVKSNAAAGNILDIPSEQTWDASTQSTKRTVLTRPSTGWKFSHWASNSGNLTIQNPLELSSQFILQSDSSVNANFLNSNIQLELSTDGGGQTSFNTTSLPFGDSVTISASANDHKVFKEWKILKEFTYEVKNSNSSVSPARTVYLLNERERPSLTFYKDFTYTFTFDQNQGEDFYISTSPNSTSDASTEVIASTTRSAISGKSLTFYVNQNSPNLLYYHSKANPGMGGSINVVDVVPTNLIPNYNSVENIITPQSDLLIKANFQNVYTLTLGTSAWGQVTGDGNYLFEDNVTISATPNAGYTFSHWEGNTTILADALSSSNSFQIPNGNLAFTPVFSPIEHTLNVQANGGGAASGGGKYFTDENATLSASANPPDTNSLNGYHLSYWEWTTPDGTVTTSSENPVNLTVDSNLSIVAYFIPTPYTMHTLDVIKSDATAGNIFDNPVMQTWDASTQSTKRTVLTRPSTGWKFSHWASNSGNLTIQNPLELSSQFILQSDSSVNANFLNSNIELELSTDGGGQTPFNTMSVPFGDSITISASANNHKVFKEWEILKEFTYEVKNSNSSVSPSRTVYFLNERERPSLTFYKDFTYTFTFDQNQGEDFYISTSPNSTSDASAEVIANTTRSAISGKSLTFYVNQNSPNLLYYHSKANPGMGGSINVVDVVPTNLIPNYNSVENIITPQSDLLIKANFQKQKYNVNFTSSLGGKLNQDISGLTEYGTEIQINAQPDEHYKFAGWDGLNSSTYSDSNISLIITESIEATAIFEPIEYNLNLTSNLDAQTSIFISPVKPYYFGSSVKIEALPIAHYNFTSWTGSISSPSPTIEISIGGNTSLHANYEQKIYNLNIVPLVENYLGSATEVFNDSFGTISKGVSSTFNSIFELEASPSIRFEFLYWKNNEGSIISNQQSLTYKISKSEKIFGIFREKSSPALISIKPQNSGEILLNGNKFNFENNSSFPYGIAQEFSPLPQPGYTFVHWEINNNVSTNSTITYDGLEPLFLNAIYEPLPFPLEIVVYPDGAGNVLTQNSKTSFLNDSTVDLTAVANPGYTFSYWNGNVSNPNNIKTSIVMKQGIKVYAHFAETAVNATATIKTLGIDGQPSDSTEGGYVNIASSYRIGTSPTVSAFPFDGYEFLHWEDENNNIFSTSLIATVPTLTKDLKISAVFQVKSYEINFFVSPLAGGHIFVQGTKVVGSHMAKIAHNEYLLITAVANPGYTFKEWDSEDGIIDLPKISSATVKINSKAKITANFEANDKLNLTILSKPLGAGWFFGQGTHAPNSSHPLFAKARKGYEFVKWEGNPSIENTLTPSTNFNFIEDTTITAIFKVIEIELPVENYAPPGIFMVDLSVNDSDAGVVIGSGVYGTGWVDISCEAKEGFIFRYWNNDIVEDKYSAQTKVFLSKDTFVTAYFDKLGDEATIPQSVVPNSLYLGSDWWSSNWFGNYWRKTNDHWVLHSKMGWIYLIPYSNDSIWLWTDKMKDWLWTNKSVYPYFLSGSNSRWFWFDKESSTPNRQLFFEYYDPEGNGKWNVYE